MHPLPAHTTYGKIIRGWLRKNWSNVLLFLFLAILIFSPRAKAVLIEGWMKVGFMKAAAPAAAAYKNAPLASPALFEDSAGNRFSLEQLRGKVVFLNFWAGWCAPCIAEMGTINRLHHQFVNDPRVVFILVDADGDFSRSLPFLRTRNYDLPVDVTMSVREDLYNGTLPTTVILDRSSRIVFREQGAANYDTPAFAGFIRHLAAE